MFPLLVAGGVAGGASAGVFAQWLRKNPGRLKKDLDALVEEARVEVDREWEAREQNLAKRRATVVAVEDRYQRLIAERFDPLLSRTRHDQLIEVKARGEVVVINEEERKVNRYIGSSLVSLGAAAVAIVYPPALIVTIGGALYCALRFFKAAYRSLRRGKLDMPVMGSIYLIGAFGGGFFLPGTFGMLVWFLSEKIVLITQDRSQSTLGKVFGEQPRTVWLAGDVEVEAPIESIQAGDTVVVQAGQVVPVDGVIVGGIATVDEHMLTGESQPVEKVEGDSVLAATLLVGGRILVRVAQTGSETIVAQIGAMLESTAAYQASIVSRGQEVADASVPPTMLLALLALPITGLRYSVTILGSSIGLNIKITAPIAMLNFLNVAANEGVLIRDGRSLELLNDVDLVVFDKTGTLTIEQPQIAEIHTCADLDADTVLRYAAAAELRQTHPIAKAILDAATARLLTLPSVDSAHYEMGYGLRVQLEDGLIRVGSWHFMELEKVEAPDGVDDLVAAVQARGHALVLVARDQQVVGAIELQSTLRPEVVDVVRRLRRRGLDLCIISGDQEEPTRRIADALGIHQFFANTLPEEKASLVTDLQANGRSVCFVGDGINDAISLKKANVSISLRGASTAATDSAQIVLMGHGLRLLPFLFDLADEFEANMRAGFGMAVGQGLVIVAGAVVGVIGIVGGALVWTAGLVAGLVIAHVPLWRRRILGPGPSERGLPAPARAELGPAKSNEANA